jgi:hypothetical protein
LLWDETAVDVRAEFVRTLDRALHPRFAGHVLDLAAEHFNELHLLFRETARDAENNTVTACDSHEREADAGVSRRRLDDRAAGFQQTFFFGVENHAESRAVFHGAAGVEPFDFCVNVSERWLNEAREMQKRSLAYEVENAFCDAKRHSSRW